MTYNIILLTLIAVLSSIAIWMISSREKCEICQVCPPPATPPATPPPPPVEYPARARGWYEALPQGLSQTSPALTMYIKYNTVDISGTLFHFKITNEDTYTLFIDRIGNAYRLMYSRESDGRAPLTRVVTMNPAVLAILQDMQWHKITWSINIQRRTMLVFIDQTASQPWDDENSTNIAVQYYGAIKIGGYNTLRKTVSATIKNVQFNDTPKPDLWFQYPIITQGGGVGA